MDTNKIDTGLHCLVMLAQFHGVATDAEQIRHSFAVGAEGMSGLDILRAAKELGFKAKEATVEYERLQKLALPAMVEINATRPLPLIPSPLMGEGEGGGGKMGQGTKDKRQFTILAKADKEQVLT